MTGSTELDKPFADALGERYLAYALSTIVARSLPDVRDGLKPVHRRLLYAMRELRLDPAQMPKKSARVVGDVIGKFHPHGEVAVYEALVRLAQDFAQRYPLVDGQGNFGNIDGDNAAAMRYTEARLTPFAEALLAGLDEDAVDFRATYDGEGQEPIVLPAAVPNLLANGAAGIAVGMATSIPPHNVGEICDALTLLLKSPQAPNEALVDRVQGPDLPTGGILVEPKEAIVSAYATGRGSFRLRARWSVEKLAQGTWQVVVTEVPYQVQKSRLVERIAELLEQRKVPLLDDVRDESAEDVRLVLVPKSRNVDASVMMEQLFRQSDLEVRVPLNMNVLDRHTVPRVMSLREVLQAYLDHRFEVLGRRTRHRLERIAARLDVLAGYLVAYLNLDEVIRIIREEDEPKPALMGRFGLTDPQAEAILNMRLRALRRLEEFEIRKENDALTAERGELQALLADPVRQRDAIGREIADTRKAFGKATKLGKRRTEIAGAPPDVDVPTEAEVEREPVTVFLSQKGWIRTVRGHQSDTSEVKYKEGDAARFVLHAETVDRLLLFASNGRFYTLAVDKLPKGRGFGEPVRLMVELESAEIVGLLRHRPDGKLLVAASDGRGFVVPETDAVAQTRAGKQVLNVTSEVVARLCVPVAGDTVAVMGNNRKLLCFALTDVPEMARGRGVMLQKYTDGSLSDATTFDLAAGLSWQSGERVRTEDMRPWLAARGSVGKLPPTGFPKTNRFA